MNKNKWKKIVVMCMLCMMVASTVIGAIAGLM